MVSLHLFARSPSFTLLHPPSPSWSQETLETEFEEIPEDTEEIPEDAEEILEVAEEVPEDAEEVPEDAEGIPEDAEVAEDILEPIWKHFGTVTVFVGCVCGDFLCLWGLSARSRISSR